MFIFVHMKFKRLFLFSTFLALFLTGCSKTPLSLKGEEFAAIADFFESGWAEILAGATLQKNGAPTEWSDYAMVINSSSQLADFGEHSWPEIDFNRYSVVVGRWGYTSGSQYVGSQKIRIAGSTLIMDLEIIYPGFGTSDAGLKRFAALYPKLPDHPIVIQRQNKTINRTTE